MNITISDTEFKKLSAYIHLRYGIKLGKEKKALVMGRLQRILEAYGLNSFSAYYDYVVAEKSGKAATELASLITTNHTYFMREASHFKFFKEKVLPQLAASVKNKDLRIWSAGCSSGEEPYTLAMLIDEYFGLEKNTWDTRLLATDLSEKALALAQAGCYSEDEIAQLPARWQKIYFTKHNKGDFQVQEHIKQQIIFRKFNLMDPAFPFRRKFHVIFCRNVMIYFDQKTRNELVQKFYAATETNGYLFIGQSESLDRTATDYKYVKPAIYRKDG